jgi:hypothetical protein
MAAIASAALLDMRNEWNLLSSCSAMEMQDRTFLTSSSGKSCYFCKPLQYDLVVLMFSTSCARRFNVLLGAQVFALSKA